MTQNKNEEIKHSKKVSDGFKLPLPLNRKAAPQQPRQSYPQNQGTQFLHNNQPKLQQQPKITQQFQQQQQQRQQLVPQRNQQMPKMEQQQQIMQQRQQQIQQQLEERF